MDLISLSRKAIHNPFHPHNFFVLFATIFIVLILGISIISVVSRFSQGRENLNKCGSSRAEEFSGSSSPTENSVYQLELNDTTNCLLSAFFTWENPSNHASVWIYHPEGKIEVIENQAEKPATQFLKASPLSSGKWRFVVKSKEQTNVNYSGNISVK